MLMSWELLIEMISVNYQNMRYARDMFKALRSFPSLRYLCIVLGFNPRYLYCKCIRSENTKGSWALRNLKYVKLVFESRGMRLSQTWDDCWYVKQAERGRSSGIYYKWERTRSIRDEIIKPAQYFNRKKRKNQPSRLN